MILRKLILLITINFVFLQSAWSEHIIFGRVISGETGEAIAGATIRVPNTNIGTYTSGRGFFRLAVPESASSVKATSIGYESSTIEIRNRRDSLIIRLRESPVMKKPVLVTAEIDAAEVIRRAIARKNENIAKLQTFSGRLYSKLSVEMDGNVFASADSKGGSVSIGTTFGGKVPEKYKLFLLETFSNVQKDYIKKISHSEIIQRRQTANIQPDNNILAIGDFISFYDEEIKIANATLVTPLSKDALSYYNFTITGKNIIDGKYVYVLNAEPTSRLTPCFTGTIKILEGDYNLIEADLKPSENTAIVFVQNLAIKQKFSESVENIWYPSLLEITANAAIDVVKGLLNIKTDIAATSIFSEVQINKPLPDSIYRQARPDMISVDTKADSSRSEFWENYALREISDREKEIYAKVDSMVVSDSIRSASSGGGSSSSDGLGYSPYFNFNRVASACLGANISYGIYGFDLATKGYFSFGLQKTLGSAELSTSLWFLGMNWINLRGGVFSGVEPISMEKSYPDWLNTIAASVFHFDYYDYVKSDGWMLGLYGKAGGLEFEVEAKFNRQFTLAKSTDKSIFSSKPWRLNPAIEEGNFSTGRILLKYGDVNFTFPTNNADGEIILEGLAGKNISNGGDFTTLRGMIKASLPLVPTGYGPMLLNLAVSGGTGKSAPPQYLFMMPSAMLIFNRPGNMLSPGPGIFGGNSYYNFYGSLNITDIWWRFLSLPLYEGRGPDLHLNASYSRYFASEVSIYQGTGRNHYSELGFGLSRIPIFISNVGFLSFDAAWGVGPVASGNFGWSLSVSLPF